MLIFELCYSAFIDGCAVTFGVSRVLFWFFSIQLLKNIPWTLNLLLLYWFHAQKALCKIPKSAKKTNMKKMFGRSRRVDQRKSPKIIRYLIKHLCLNNKSLPKGPFPPSRAWVGLSQRDQWAFSGQCTKLLPANTNTDIAAYSQYSIAGTFFNLHPTIQIWLRSDVKLCADPNLTDLHLNMFFCEIK